VQPLLLLDLLHARSYLAAGEVAVAIVDRRELGAIEGLNRIQSSRRLERETQRNVELFRMGLHALLGLPL